MENEEHIKRSWEANARAWEATVRKGLIESRRLATNEAIVNAVLKTGAKKVLDAGCGEGWLCRELAGTGIEMWGIDGSAPLIEMARAKGKATYFVMSYEDLISSLGRLPGLFDCVVCNFSLLGKDVLPLLKTFREMLVPAGYLLVQTVHPVHSIAPGEPYADGWRAETFSRFEERFPETMPWYFRTLGSWVEQIVSAGFAVEAIEEPLHPESGSPLSLLLYCRPA